MNAVSEPRGVHPGRGRVGDAGALRQAFVAALSVRFTFGSPTTFFVTIAGYDPSSIHAAFWGILLGCVVSRFLEPQVRRTVEAA